MATARRAPSDGSVHAAAQPPMAVSNSSPSRRCSVRRMVDSLGGHPVTSSAARTSSEALAAHSPIAVNERQPASTAHAATARIVVIP